MGRHRAVHSTRLRSFLRWQIAVCGAQRGALPAVLAALALAVLAAGAPPAAGQFNGSFAIEEHSLGNQENWLDFLAYQHTRAWAYDWYTAANGLDATVGSLSASRFYHFREIRFQQAVAEGFTFTYRQEEDSFFRPGGTWQEVGFRVGDDLNAAVVLFPSFDKTQMPLGAAIGYGDPTRWNYARYTWLRQDMLFNERAETTQRFERLPALHRLELRTFWQRRLFVQLRVRVEPEAELHSPDDGMAQTYEGRKYDLVADWHGEGWLAGITLNANRERRERLPLDAGSPVTPLAQTLGWGYAQAYVSSALPSGGLLEAGLFYGLLDNEITGSDIDERYDFRHDTDAAYVRWVQPATATRAWHLALMGGDVRRELAWGDAGRLAHKIDRSVQSKLGTGVLFHGDGRYRVLVQPTWNVDALPADPWDGGNVQVQLRF